jgi:glycopeptide antibiotics resistance protein
LAFRIPSLRIGAAVVGLIVGSILEVGQLFVAARTADATDAITAAIGAMIGSILWRRSTSARSTAVAASSPEVRTRRELDRAIARRRAGDDSVAAK